MPINPSALSSPQPDPEPEQTAPVEQTEPKTRTRRKKAEIIAAAVIPADDAPIEIKDVNTGAKVTRPWSEALQLFKNKQAEFVTKQDNGDDLKYAVLKLEQQEAAGAFEDKPAPNVFDQSPKPQMDFDTAQGLEDRWVGLQVKIQAAGDPDEVSTLSEEAENVRQQLIAAGFQDVSSDEAYARRERNSAIPLADAPVQASGNVPPEAELGDLVRVGSEELRVGHGGVLTSSPVAVNGEVVEPKRRWQRELGAGPNGPWESVFIGKVPSQPNTSANAFGSPSQAPNDNSSSVDHPPVTVQTERLPREIEQLDLQTWKIGTGTLEKIGMPDYSSYQIGPITASRMVIDDGRRMKVTMSDGREAEIPASVVEAFETMDNTIEFINGRFRGQLLSFLQAMGVTQQPVA